jgi:hypothetical protein
MMSTFPVHEISFNCTDFPSEMSMSRSDSRHVGFASRLSCNESAAAGDIVSPGFSSLSSSSANPVAVFDFKSVWDFENIEQSLQTWICHWCNGRFCGWNAMKVLNHVSKNTGKTDIKACTGSIPMTTLAACQSFCHHKLGLTELKYLHSDALSDCTSENQQSLAIAYSIKRSCSSNSSSTATFLGSQNGKLEGGVGASNATRLTSAIAEFVYCKGLSFLATEGDQFMQILKLACVVNSPYWPPNRNLLSNELLDISSKN